jgi:hypothetical protein
MRVVINFADSHITSNTWKNDFCLLLNVRRVSDVRLKEIQTAEPRPCEVDIAIAEFERYKSSGIDQNPAELIQGGGETLRSDVHNQNNPIWNIEKFPSSRRCLLLYQFYKGR